jgi:hypothetical protein
VTSLNSGVKFGYEKTLNFQDGSSYVGQVKNGNYNGKGTMIFPDGATYVGQWKNGIIMAKALSHFLVEKNMLESGRMTKDMVKVR